MNVSMQLYTTFVQKQYIYIVKSIDIDKKSFYVHLTQVRKGHINSEDVWIISPNMINPELTYFL